MGRFRTVASRSFAGALALTVLSVQGAGAIGGVLDPSFGTGGQVKTRIAAGTSARDVAIQDDGSIVVVGTITSETELHTPLLAVLRYTPSGELDPSFGGTGYVTTGYDFGGLEGGAHGVALAIQPDGKVLVVGNSDQITHGAGAFFVLRYDSDGTPDATFGTGGKFELRYLGASGGDIALTDDGKMLVSYAYGEAYTGSTITIDSRVTRLDSDGRLDPTFGNDGETILPIVWFLGSGPELAVRRDGKIVVTASNLLHYQPTIREPVVARLLPDGTIDSSFGIDGFSRPLSDRGVDAMPTDIVAQDDDRIVIAGTLGGQFALLGVTADGGLDASFGDAGVFTDASLGVPRGLVRLADGRLVAAGVPGFALERFTASGGLDPSFGNGGKVTTSFGDPFAVALALAAEADGTVVAVGNTGSEETADSIALARYVDPADECPGSARFYSARLGMTDFQLPGCNARLVLSGRLRVPADPAVDPIATGLHVVMRDATGGVVADETLPPGAFDPETESGWRMRVRPDSVSWRFTRPEANGAAVDGALISQKSGTPGRLRIVLRGRRACLSDPPTAMLLSTAVALTPEACGEARFSESACAVRPSRAMVCRQTSAVVRAAARTD
jgi:uncharacterized delta-60 repeat protein